MSRLPPKRERASLGCDERGLSTLEYALIFVVILVAGLALWQRLAGSMQQHLASGTRAFAAMSGEPIQGVSGAHSITLTGAFSSTGASQVPASPVSAHALAPAHAHAPSTAPSPNAGNLLGAPPPAVSAAPASPSTGALPAHVEQPAPSPSPSLSQQIHEYVSHTPFLQYAAGIGYGITQGFTPGGFLVVPSPNPHSKPFELGHGLGQMAASVVQGVEGLGLMGGGGAMTAVGAPTIFTPASPVGGALVAVGVPAMTAGGVLVGHATVNGVSGYETFIHAMSMSDESMASGSANAGSGSGGPAPKPAAAAGGKDIPPHELGKLLGAGGEKEVYAYGEKQAVGVLKPGRDPASIDNEVANLAKLRQEGLPAANASKVTVGGKPAILFEQRFVQGSKEVVRTIKGKVSVVGRSPYLNARSAADLRAIRQTLIDKQVSVKDLQFLIAEDGKVVIADPLGVVEGAAPSRTNLATIDKLIQVAEGR